MDVHLTVFCVLDNLSARECTCLSQTLHRGGKCLAGITSTAHIPDCQRHQQERHKANDGFRRTASIPRRWHSLQADIRSDDSADDNFLHRVLLTQRRPQVLQSAGNLFLVAHHGFSDPRALLSRSVARDSCLVTVPIGRPVISAISRTVCPSK